MASAFEVPFPIQFSIYFRFYFLRCSLSVRCFPSHLRVLLKVTLIPGCEHSRQNERCHWELQRSCSCCPSSRLARLIAFRHRRSTSQLLYDCPLNLQMLFHRLQLFVVPHTSHRPRSASHHPHYSNRTPRLRRRVVHDAQVTTHPEPQTPNKVSSIILQRGGPFNPD